MVDSVPPFEPKTEGPAPSLCQGKGGPRAALQPLSSRASSELSAFLTQDPAA